MQTLYNVCQDEVLDFKAAQEIFSQSVNRSFTLYLFNILQLQKIAGYAHKDASKRTKKLLPTDEDKAFTPKLSDNELTQSLDKNLTLEKIYKEHNITSRVDEDNTRKFYVELAKTEEYKSYILKETTNEGDHRNILLTLYKQFIKNEAFQEQMEDLFISWDDDKSLIIGAMKKTIKALPCPEDFYKSYQPDDETVKELGEELLYKTFHSDKELIEIIQPKLKNWEMDRVAIIDMILIKMAITELIFFETIPTKVTINEYIEISKLYSTPKSKDFINGLLDKTMKYLLKEGKINKSGRGLLD